MAQEKILLVISDIQLGKLLSDGILRPGGFQVTLIDEISFASSVLDSSKYDLLIIEEKSSDDGVQRIVENTLKKYPNLSIIMVSHLAIDMERMRVALQLGVTDYLELPLKPSNVVQAVRNGLERRRRIDKWSSTKVARQTGSLIKQVDSLKELEIIGRSVTASLDLDHVLKVIVDAAVNLTGAEEGSLLVLDENSGELVMRASRNFQDEFVRTFRLPVSDTLAGQVVKTGLPILLNGDTPQKIKTTYLVRTIMYVPMKIHGKVIGVLGVDNREKGQPFSQRHLTLVSTLADYAAIAIENASLYNNSEVERDKLETILTQIEDGVIVIGLDYRLMLANRIARDLFDLHDEKIFSKNVDEVFKQDTFLEFLNEQPDVDSFKSEIQLENGRILNAQRVHIPKVGTAITVQDITNFIELDRIKSDFVNTVSHDLRSPLTAILGYVELISRVGDVNKKQQEFINRVQISVRNITELINDLLDLGRIEAGFDTRNDFVPLDVIVEYAIEGLQTRIDECNITLFTDFSDSLPKILGDPVRLRQIADNLLNNAVRYSPRGSTIAIRLRAENEQVILEVQDTGIGIPMEDQKFIFDKFYRATNVPHDNAGSGLGLAIVKSIVDNHNGRIWVDSHLGRGTRFTVVLPVS